MPSQKFQTNRNGYCDQGGVVEKKDNRENFLLDIVNSMVLGYNMKRSKDFRVAVICSSNQNRSMEAHSFLRLFKFIALVASYYFFIHLFTDFFKRGGSTDQNWKYVSCGKWQGKNWCVLAISFPCIKYMIWCLVYIPFIPKKFISKAMEVYSFTHDHSSQS